MRPALAQENWGSSSPLYVAARSAVLMNPDTGEILFAKEPHLRLPPASTTKVLTALLAIERLDPNSRVQVSPRAASAAPSRIGLHAGETASTQDLLYGLLLKSGNDAAETLAEAAGGSIYGFADLMNTKAWQIGARNSHFANPHGLPDEDHYSTAYDLALIFRHAMNYPMFADIVRTRSAALRIESGQGPYGDSRLVSVLNHNRLLASYEGARGGKTGFTIKARRCFVGEVDRGGIRLIVSILNSPNSGTLWQDARSLLDYGFAHYGLAPPPPAQPDIEPQPILVRHTPITMPDIERVATTQSAAEDDEPEPLATQRRFSAIRPVSDRATATRLVATEKSRPLIAPKTKSQAKPSKLTTSAKPTGLTKLATPAKSATSAQSSTIRGKGKLANVRSTTRTATLATSNAKPPTNDAPKGTRKAGKPNKPATAAAATKPEKQAASKVIARAEPPSPKSPPKNAKRRI
ncbi:MAG TPA: serine hydrolase [Candidatus Competibacter sp.]|nr:serine hydrolase [Candidatus Competibacter sp.]